MARQLWKISKANASRVPGVVGVAEAMGFYQVNLVVG